MKSTSPWNKIPEPARWVLCWPAIFIPSILLSVGFPVLWGFWLSSTPEGLLKTLIECGTTTLTVFLFCWSAYTLTLILAPKKQDIVAIFYAVLLNLFALSNLIYSAILFYQGRMNAPQMLDIIVFNVAIIGISLFYTQRVRKAVADNKREISYLKLETE